MVLILVALMGGGTTQAKNRDKNNIIVIVREDIKKQMTEQEIKKEYKEQTKSWNDFLQKLYRDGKINRVTFKALKK